ncbi:replicative helicase loader/inhibitor [Paenibacillus sp. ClWae2A]|uniref:Replicative helicase inhibitor G39P N-terminal domain-containing protein n=1 Tax=Paenibacillus xylanexedens TaxID=528191 RepID=A0ABS4S2I6_PAEXY|nr:MULTISPECIES: replicative helicase loader/inhibitor [Paenibacillus]APO43309.1 hypothetical protein BS614_04075 [Paenibacillus xylanexedens]MBP2249244.1 hypothetical protein [Paenibacillus xylanexedens]MDT9719167.1 replicative helicase loader/inhibitor [Paenibacillus sp. ClWae2A]
MEKADVIRLFMAITDEYPTFDDSEENVDRHYKHLQDFPYEAAIQNLDQHIKTIKWPPTISEIRGRLGEQIERERMRDLTETYFAEREAAALKACPPPPGWKDELLAKLRHRK